jgi:hypothetical protein
MLSPEGIAALRRKAKADSAYFRKAFANLKLVDGKVTGKLDKG